MSKKLKHEDSTIDPFYTSLYQEPGEVSNTEAIDLCFQNNEGLNLYLSSSSTYTKPYIEDDEDEFLKNDNYDTTDIIL